MRSLHPNPFIISSAKDKPNYKQRKIMTSKIYSCVEYGDRYDKANSLLERSERAGYMYRIQLASDPVAPSASTDAYNTERDDRVVGAIISHQGGIKLNKVHLDSQIEQF